MKNLQQFIGLDQSGFLKGRHLNDAIHRVINIINFGAMVDTPIITMFVDAEKAFDKVE